MLPQMPIASTGAPSSQQVQVSNVTTTTSQPSPVRNMTVLNHPGALLSANMLGVSNLNQLVHNPTISTANYSVNMVGGANQIQPQQQQQQQIQHQPLPMTTTPAAPISVAATTYAPPPQTNYLSQQQQQQPQQSMNTNGLSIQIHNSMPVSLPSIPQQQQQQLQPQPSPRRKLAVVPTFQLSSSSIVSLKKEEPVPGAVDSSSSSFTTAVTTPSTDITTSPSTSTNCQSTVPVKSESNTSFQSQQQLPIIQNSILNPKPTALQVLERQKNSYSSASIATILAQQKLNIKSQKSDSTSSLSSASSSGSNKRPLSTMNASSSSCVALSSSSIVHSAYSPSKKKASPMNQKCGNNIISSSVVESVKVPVFGGMPQTTPLTQACPSPQTFLTNLLTQRGYSIQHYCSLEGGYYCKPTPLQKASYGMKISQAVRNSNEKELRTLLESGLSPNPCNAFGESSIHTVCRRGDTKLLKVFVENGGSVQVSDDFGRTPLHDACWTATPCFELVELILSKDVRLLHVVDCRGSPPLSYTKKEDWKRWIEFFDSKKEVFWPARDVNVDGEEAPPPLILEAPHSRPIPDPPNAVSVEQAKSIAAGK